MTNCMSREKTVKVLIFLFKNECIPRIANSCQTRQKISDCVILGKLLEDQSSGIR